MLKDVFFFAVVIVHTTHDPGFLDVGKCSHHSHPACDAGDSRGACGEDCALHSCPKVDGIRPDEGSRRPPAGESTGAI